MSKEREPVKDLNEQLVDLIQGVSLASDFRGALATCLEGAGQIIPCDGCSVMWLEGDHLEILAGAGSTAPLPGLILPADQMGAARIVLDSGKVALIPDVNGDGRWQPVPREQQVRAWLAAPLQIEGRVIGVLEWSAKEPGAFDARAAEEAAQMARLMAPQLHRAQMLDDTRRRLREAHERRLISAPQVVDLGAELQPVVREARDYAQAHHAFVFLLGEGTGRLRCVAASGDLRDRLMSISLRGDGTLGGWSIPIQSPAEWLGAGPSDQEVMASAGIENTLILPLRVGGRQVGMLGVAEPKRGRVFSQDAIRLMTHLVSQVSLIVDRSYKVRPGTQKIDYDALIQSSPLGVGVLTVTGDIRFCSPALGDLLSSTGGSLAGRNLADLFMAGDCRRLARAMEDVVISGKRQQVDARIPSLREGNRHLRISLALAQISDDADGNLVAIMEDVTPLKILEKERVEHLRELREKHALLEELDQVKSRFVSNVSHELRTPLAVIKLYATLARKGRPEKQAFYLQTIEQETHRLETMVENILDLTRMDRHTLRVHPEVVAAEEIIEQVLEMYEESARKRGIELRNHVRGDLPPLWADKNHLIQMLTNLVDNALKYTPRDGQIWVAARTIGNASNPLLEIAVGDTGTGIPEDEQDRIFDRFYRGSNNTPGSTGTGLGLAIVQELMVQHGGQVTLKSQWGEGCTFALQFPLRDLENLPDPTPDRAKEGERVRDG